MAARADHPAQEPAVALRTLFEYNCTHGEYTCRRRPSRRVALRERAPRAAGAPVRAPGAPFLPPRTGAADWGECRHHTAGAAGAGTGRTSAVRTAGPPGVLRSEPELAHIRLPADVARTDDGRSGSASCRVGAAGRPAAFRRGVRLAGTRKPGPGQRRRPVGSRGRRVRGGHGRAGVRRAALGTTGESDRVRSGAVPHVIEGETAFPSHRARQAGPAAHWRPSP